MKRALFPSYRQLLMISVVDTFISTFLFLRKSASIKTFPIKNAFPQSSTTRYLNSLINLNNSLPFSNIESKSAKSGKFGSLNKVQLIEIIGIHEHCIPQHTPLQTLAWCWLAWTTLKIVKLPILFNSIIFVALTTIASIIPLLESFQQKYYQHCTSVQTHATYSNINHHYQ